MLDFTIGEDPLPLITGLASSAAVFDYELYLDNITSLPEAYTESGCPERTFLDNYFNRRHNRNAGPNQTISWGREFEFIIDIFNDAFICDMKLQFHRPAMRLQPNNKFGMDGFIAMTRDLGHNIFEYLHVKINDDQKLLGELCPDLLNSNTYFDLEAGLREAFFEMIGNVPEQVEPHGVGRFIPAHTYIVPLKNCFNEDFANRFPIAALGPTKTLRVCGKLKPLTEVVVFGNSTLLNQQQPVSYVRPQWLETRHNELNCITDFNLYYKVSRIPDFDLNAMIFGAEQRNLCMEVFDPLPFYEPLDISSGDACTYTLGDYANVHHIFAAVKNISNSAVGSCYSTLLPELQIAPGTGPGSALGKWKWNPNNNHSPYESMEFTYNGISEIVNWRDLQLFNPYEMCRSTPMFHTRGLGVKSFDPFRLHPQLRGRWPNGHKECIKLRVNPSPRLIETIGRDYFLELEELIVEGDTIPQGAMKKETVEGRVELTEAKIDEIAARDTTIIVRTRVSRPCFKIFVSVVTVRIFRIEGGSIALIPPVIETVAVPV